MHYKNCNSIGLLYVEDDDELFWFDVDEVWLLLLFELFFYKELFLLLFLEEDFPFILDDPLEFSFGFPPFKNLLENSSL
mgnify:CR=1 FL=1